MPVRISGTGAYLPARIVTNRQLAGQIDTSDEWIQERTGIKQRHIAGDDEACSDLALHASRNALTAAGIGADDIGLIIVATTTPDMIFPSTACILQSKLGATHCAAFDLQAVCSGFVYALATADNFILPMLVNQIAGTRMKPVTGYQGQNEINIAAERGEVQGNNTGLSNITVNKADWLRDGKVRILLQYGVERLPGLPAVPTAVELARSEADRALLRFYAVKFSMARPLMAPPEVPAERLAALRSAFDATMKDPQFLDEAQRIGLDVSPLGGDGITKLIQQVQATPQDVVDRLRELLARPK